MDPDLQRVAALLAAANGIVAESDYLAASRSPAPFDTLVARGLIAGGARDALLALARERIEKVGRPADLSSRRPVSSDDRTVLRDPGPAAAPGPAPQGDRFEILHEIGRGGLGSVVEATDRDLGRTVALKLAPLALSEDALVRFRWEARVTGRLEHPNIVPVHEMGTLPGTGQAFFAMKRVAGRNLRQAVQAFHRGEEGWTLRRLVESFRDVCRAVAYAHARGILHRDLKPANVMVGDFGETLVVDWGLAKAIGEVADPARGGAGAAGAGTDQPVSRDSTARTLEGDVLGTPSYMPPEQARGRHGDLDERSDVYSLGAMLYEILAGRPPFEGTSHVETLFAVVEQPVIPPSNLRSGVPADLEAACLKAISKRMEDRFAAAGDLGREVEAWLEGTRERERRGRLAEEQVAQAGREMARWQERAAEANEQARKARESRGAMKPHAGAEEKRPVWELEDRARNLERESLSAFTAANLALATALSNVPGHAGALRLRAELHWQRFLDAEGAADVRGMELNLRLAERFNDGSLDAALRGDGRLEIRTRAYPCRCLLEGREVSPAELQISGWHPWSGRESADPGEAIAPGLESAESLHLRVHAGDCRPIPLPGACVWAWKLEDIDRVLVPVTPEGATGGPGVPEDALDRLFGDSPYRPRGPGIALGETPLAPRCWPMGSWLAVLVAPGRAPVRVPFRIRRQQDVVLDVTLFDPAEIPAGCVQVAGGAFEWQGDGANPYSDPAEVRTGGDVFFEVYPVTCAAYAEFLNALDPAEGVRRAPRESIVATVPWWPRHDGRFRVPTEAWLASVPEEVRRTASRPTYAACDWETDWPVFAISWEDASACARWRSLRDGRLFTLPPETDWEHAARGADGRAFPWGNSAEAHISNTNTSQPGGMRPARVHEFPLDESPYGVRGMGGNIQQWCLSEANRGGRRWTMIRGVSWPQSLAQSRASIRTAATRNYLNFTVGFRLVAPVRLD